MGAAFCRLVEQQQPVEVRQFDDPVVARLVDPLLLAMAQPGPMQEQVLSSLGPGTFGGQVMRTRYIDDVVTAAVTRGVDQVVILGAGLDTRAYRLAQLAAATVTEVDLPAIQALKIKRLRGVPVLARRLVHLPLDLSNQQLGEALTGSGFDATAPAVFVWEGVTQYLTGAAVNATLDAIGRATAGSELLVTYVLRGVVEGTDAQEWAAPVRRLLGASEPWVFGLDPSEVPSLLRDHGLTLVEDVGEPDYRHRYLDPVGRRLEVSRGERVAHAVVGR